MLAPFKQAEWLMKNLKASVILSKVKHSLKHDYNEQNNCLLQVHTNVSLYVSTVNLKRILKLDVFNLKSLKLDVFSPHLFHRQELWFLHSHSPLFTLNFLLFMLMVVRGLCGDDCMAASLL
ncbi:hypothetical protein XENOCAPTIV_025209 [Xenoophorus captivus]|uniref:Uncharacterized protein n=1 Tax=Xenoophorus captivus TaxID=1517983 RepID=A0ABV0SI81_9TELE